MPAKTKSARSAAAKKAWATRRKQGWKPKSGKSKKKKKRGRCLKWSKKVDPRTGKKRCLKRAPPT